MLNTYDNFTLNSIFLPKAFIKKNMHFNVNYIVSVPPSCSWNWSACFLDNGIWPKYLIKSKIIMIISNGMKPTQSSR